MCITLIISILLFYSATMAMPRAVIGSYDIYSHDSSLPFLKRASNGHPYIQLVENTFNPPGTIDGSGNFDYSFVAENGIEQEGFGSTKIIGDTEIIVMKGSYKYVGPDGQTYVLDWYADETGYHPSAPHLPQDVPIPYPEIANAVDAQIAFAATEKRFNGKVDVYPQISRPYLETSGYGLF
uniref:Cuticular protein RR1 motif 44 [Bombyx mori] n=1 Tax=Lepeophtheirus salmonis TaxID=72036 RepID=A0A0K2TGJ5_LEPSM